MGLRKQIWWLAAIGAVDVIFILMILGMIGGTEIGSRGEKCIGIEGDRALHVSGENMEKYLALTFDDGPDQTYTEQLLDGLKERDVKATFFLTGACISGNEEIVKRMHEEGHLVGVHCMQHTDLTKMPVTEALEQLKETGRKVEAVTGVWPEYIRPPYGSWNEKLGQAVLEELQMIPVFWNVDSLDWELQNVGKIVKKVLADVENGDIILMHDEFDTSVEAALAIIDNLMAKGYTFVTANELMVD